MDDLGQHRCFSHRETFLLHPYAHSSQGGSPGEEQGDDYMAGVSNREAMVRGYDTSVVVILLGLNIY